MCNYQPFLDTSSTFIKKYANFFVRATDKISSFFIRKIRNCTERGLYFYLRGNIPRKHHETRDIGQSLGATACMLISFTWVMSLTQCRATQPQYTCKSPEKKMRREAGYWETGVAGNKTWIPRLDSLPFVDWDIADSQSTETQPLPAN
jgi:hypothetical protein